jgi:hypothetical protein
MGEPLPNVAYHVRELHKLGALALVRERQVRGAVEHTYTATVRISLKQEPLLREGFPATSSRCLVNVAAGPFGHPRRR